MKRTQKEFCAMVLIWMLDVVCGGAAVQCLWLLVKNKPVTALFAIAVAYVCQKTVTLLIEQMKD